MESWCTTPTIQSVKEYLDGELGKYNSWEDTTDTFFSGLFPEPIVLKRWNQLKLEGIGRETIQRFLNKGQLAL